MFNLDKILDEVREKYYSSNTLNRPTISWSEDYITDYFGMYNFYDNHIVVSRILNDKRVSKEMISSVIYHESLHQDFKDHDSKFDKRALLFPDYVELQEQLNKFAENIRTELEYKIGYNQFTKGKERVIYINLPRYEDYPQAFVIRDGKMLIDFNADVTFIPETTDKDLYVFLVKVNDNYNIVGWCSKGILARERITVKHSKYGDIDYSYQLISDFDNTYLIPLTCCDYAIPSEMLPNEFIEKNCYCFEKDNEDIQPDLDYIESYCEGYFKVGFDMKNINCIPDFKDISIEEMKKIKRKGYHNVWLTNAIYAKEQTYENLTNRAKARYDSWLLTPALEDFIEANKMNPNDISIVIEIIRIAILTEKFELARKYMSQYDESLSQKDRIINNFRKELKDK